MLHLMSEFLGLNRGRVVLRQPEDGSYAIRYAYGLTADEIGRGGPRRHRRCRAARRPPDGCASPPARGAWRPGWWRRNRAGCAAAWPAGSPRDAGGGGARHVRSAATGWVARAIGIAEARDDLGKHLDSAAGGVQRIRLLR